MRSIREELHGSTAADDTRVVPDVAAAVALAGEGWFPELTLVLQRRPDEYVPRDPLNLLNTFPLTRLVCCYGYWCEADGRNRDVWPPATRIAARSAVPRIRRELEVLDDSRRPLPMTAGREEVFAFDCPGTLPRDSTGGTVGVVSPDRTLREWLCVLLSAAGYQPVPYTGEPAQSDAVVWDVDPLNDAMQQRLQRFRTESSQVPVVSVMNAATQADVSLLAGLGIETVVPKLASHELLIDAIALLPGRVDAAETRPAEPSSR